MYAAKGEYEQAIRDFDEAIRLNPNYAEAFLNRGIARLRRGDSIGGNADIAKAKLLDPSIAGYPIR